MSSSSSRPDDCRSKTAKKMLQSGQVSLSKNKRSVIWHDKEAKEEYSKTVSEIKRGNIKVKIDD